MIEKTIIIAEAGVNHNGDINLAKKLIDAAVSAGVDFIKFQTFKANKLVTKKADRADYQKENTKNNESQYEMLKKLELDEKTHFKSAITYGGFGDAFRRPFKRSSMPRVNSKLFLNPEQLIGKVWRDSNNTLRVKLHGWTSSFKTNNRRYIVIAFKGLQVNTRLTNFPN